MSIPQALYESEIDFEIASDWDNGFRVRLCHIYVGNPVVEVWAPDYETAVDELRKLAIKLYPESKFATDCAKKVQMAGVLTD